MDIAFPETAQTYRLSNGLTVCLEHLPYLHSASVGVWINTGSANEAEAVAGVAHFLEHLFFKGTTSRTAREISEAIEGRGGQLNAFTSRGYTCLYAKVLARDVPVALEVLSDLVRNCTFSDWEKERNVVLEEIASIEDDPEDHIQDLFSQKHWPAHPLGRPVIGFQQTVSRLTDTHVREFFDTWYKPGNMVVSLAGNFDDAAVRALIEEYFGGIVPGEVPGPCDAPAFYGGTSHVVRDSAQAHYAIAFPGPALDAPDRYTCDLLSTILGGGATSRLFERIREQEGLAYSIYTYHSFYPMTGLLGVSAAVAPHSVRRALDLTFDEIRSIRDKGVPETELAMNREQIKGNMMMALESTFTRMSRMAKCMMYYGRIVPIAEIIGQIDAVTREDIQGFAAQCFQSAHCALMVLGPENAAPAEAIAL